MIDSKDETLAARCIKGTQTATKPLGVDLGTSTRVSPQRFVRVGQMKPWMCLRNSKDLELNLMLWHTPYWSKLLLETSGGRFLITWQRYSICRERISFLTVLRSVFSAKWHAGRRLFKPLRIYLFTSSAYLLMLAFLQPLSWHVVLVHLGRSL